MQLNVGVGKKVGQGRPITPIRRWLIGEMLLEIELKLHALKLSAALFAPAIGGALCQFLKDLAGRDHSAATRP
jgi:hypothetical protein